MRHKKNQAKYFYMFIMPWFLGFFLLTFMPLVYSIYLSLTQYNGISIPKGWKKFNKSVFFDALDYAVDGVVLNEIQDEIIKVELELLFAGEQDIDTTLKNIQTKGQLKLDRMKE